MLYSYRDWHHRHQLSELGLSHGGICVGQVVFDRGVSASVDLVEQELSALTHIPLSRFQDTSQVSFSLVLRCFSWCDHPGAGIQQHWPGEHIWSTLRLPQFLERHEQRQGSYDAHISDGVISNRWRRDPVLCAWYRSAANSRPCVDV